MNVEELIPHDGAMCLLDRVVEAGADFVETELRVRRDGLFDDGHSVPAWLGLEYMAQAAAAWAGLRARDDGTARQVGFLLGTRCFTTSVARLPCDTVLRVRARQLAASEQGLATFDCELFDCNDNGGDGIHQQAVLSVYRPTDPEAQSNTQDSPL